jgi:16S rRNA (guanine527-N7)-methyltransferase
VTDGARPNSAEVRSRLRTGAASLGTDLDEAQLAALERFLDELMLWNTRTNLVGERDWQALVDRHLLDALAAAPWLRALGDGLRILDVGSGAGLPGIPLAVAVRPRGMWLVEPRRKRASFLRSVRRALPGFGLGVVEARGEDVAWAPENRAHFDAVVSRATLSDEDLRTCAEPVLRDGGLLVAYRGSRETRTPRDGAPSGAWAGPIVQGYVLGAARRAFQLDVWTRRFT